MDWALQQGWPEPDIVVGLGSGTNARPDYQQLLTGIELAVWLDSADEPGELRLEDRVRDALANPASVTRFGGLSFGESTHLVDEVCVGDRATARIAGRTPRAFLLAPKGRLTLPVWVDHVGSQHTRYATGDLVTDDVTPERLPRISPE